MLWAENSTLQVCKKKAVEMDIVTPSANDDKNHAIYQNNKQTSSENKELDLVQSVHINIYQSNTYRKRNWKHFDDQPRVQESQFI